MIIATCCHLEIPILTHFFKDGPLIEHFHEKFKAIPMSSMQCIDKQTIPFQGNSSIKMYSAYQASRRSMATKFSFFVTTKVWFITFELYYEEILPPDNTVDLGTTSNIYTWAISIKMTPNSFKSPKWWRRYCNLKYSG